MAQFESAFGINDRVEVDDNGRSEAGRVVGVYFTAAKVWYDIVSDVYGVVMENVDSADVTAFGAH